MTLIILLLDAYYVCETVTYDILCGEFSMPVELWMCVNSISTNSSSMSKATLPELLRGIELTGILSLVSWLAVLMSNGAFVWCMCQLKQQSDHCVKLDQFFSPAPESAAESSLFRKNLVRVNIAMLFFGCCLVSKVLWFNFTSNVPLGDYVSLSLSVIPRRWSILTSCWMFSVITIAMKDCVVSCEYEIKNATNRSVNDIIRIHKRLCEQISCTSKSLERWFMLHWFFLAVTVVVYAADMANFFQKNSSEYFKLYQAALISVVYLYSFVYPSYCAASVTVRCNQMLKNLNKTSDWNTGHPFHSRAQLALFIQYAQYTECGYQVGGVTFGSNLVWFSTLVAMCGLSINVL